MSTAGPETATEVAITCLSTGAVRVKRGTRGMRRYLPGGWRDATMPVNVFALRHPAGVCLFDAGQSAAAAAPGYFPRWYPFFRLARFELGAADEASRQLVRLGMGSEPPRWVVLSHLHTDHAGGLASLRAREVVVSRSEWRRAAGVRGRLRGYLPQYWPPDVAPRLVDFEGPAIGPFPASQDLAGDGSLVLVPTPGHTPGHMGLLVTAGRRRFLLAGDLCESAADLEAVAPALAAFCRRESIAVLATHDSGAPAVLERRG